MHKHTPNPFLRLNFLSNIGCVQFTSNRFLSKITFDDSHTCTHIHTYIRTYTHNKRRVRTELNCAIASFGVCN